MCQAETFCLQKAATWDRASVPLAVWAKIASGDRFDPAAGELHANPAPHDLKQDFNATRVVQPVENPPRLCKGSGYEAYLLTPLERIDELEPPQIIARLDQRLHDPSGTGTGWSCAMNRFAMPVVLLTLRQRSRSRFSTTNR